MGKMLWLDEIAESIKHGDYCDDDVDKIIAVVRFAEGTLDRIQQQPGTLWTVQGWAANAVARLRSGDFEETPCKPS